MAFIVLQTFALVYLLVLLSCTASLLSHDEECIALFQFKQSILHQNNDALGFKKLDSWSKTSSDNGSDCCLSYGVKCSNKGHVIGLDWSGDSLSGMIKSSSTLFKLVHLQMINLSMNNFVESEIPPEIARLKQLRSLDLSYSGFNGKIPNEISQLIQLSWLDMSGNPLKLQSPGLEYLLQNMTRLENLHLSGVDLTSSVPRFLANFSSLMSIQLVDCNLQDEFPSAIFHLPKLKHLGIGNNYNLNGSLPEFHNNTLLEYLSLDSTGFSGIIPESIGNLNHLEHLSLEFCSFLGPIPGSLPNLTHLTFLSLSDNKLTGIVPSLESLSKLKVLVLGYNFYGIDRVYDWINKLTKLNILDLDRMNIQYEILPCLANLTELSSVSMARNSIFGRIPSSFMNLTHLRLIDLTFNHLQGQISSTYLNFKSLEELYVSNNNFTGTFSLDSFLGLEKLQNLDLEANRLSFVTTSNNTNQTLPELKYLGFSSCNLKEFPAFLRFNTKLTALILYNNEIEGLIPNWIWNNSQETLGIIGLGNNFITGFHQNPRFLAWKRLEAFDVSYNYLTYNQLPIPPQTIVVYDVSGNNLAGEIPPWICELKSLQLLALSSNKLTGTLPQCLGKLNNSLSILDLKRNNLNGPMMVTCTHGSLLKAIDLSENQFTGKLNKSLANCTSLEFLSLADNSFKDVFPLWLGTLPKLQVLILRSNKFYGSIHGLSTISSQFLNLRIIDVSNNSFSGQLLDKSFQTWSAMKYVYPTYGSAMGYNVRLDKLQPFGFQYSMTLTNKGVKTEYKKIQNIFTAIDLSCNNFEGKLPQSLQDLHGLESLNLSNNHFTGHVLPSLGNLTNLESLDLSQNKLSGQLPQQLLQLGFLAILNVSFNHLDGRIPEGKQFNTFGSNSYLGNPGLCGKPLSKECENSMVPSVHPLTSNNEYESLLPSDRTDWMVILLGVGSGLLIGIVVGNFVYAWYGDWLLEQFGMRKDRWVKPLRNTRRN